VNIANSVPSSFSLAWYSGRFANYWTDPDTGWVYYCRWNY